MAAAFAKGVQTIGQWEHGRSRFLCILARCARLEPALHPPIVINDWFSALAAFERFSFTRIPYGFN